MDSNDPVLYYVQVETGHYIVAGKLNRGDQNFLAELREVHEKYASFRHYVMIGGRKTNIAEFGV